jgi:protein-S-isoprenylcysteine O-methyltransferase Ste14
MIHFSGIFILACFIVFILFWIVSARSAKPALEKRGFGWPRGSLLIVVAILVVLHRMGIIHDDSDLLWQHSLITNLIADSVTLVGLGITLWARVILGRNWSLGVAFKKDHELIDRGPYKLVRHPIYTGLLMMVMGIAILHSSVVSIAMFVGIFIGFWIKANSEEQLMTEHFPNEYPAYKARTKRLIPFVL